MKTLPIAIRDFPPEPEGWTRLNGIRPIDGCPDGFHTGGAWLSPDEKEVWKPLDGRPYGNARCHVHTNELECLQRMAGQPCFPINWRVEQVTRDGLTRRFLVRRKSRVLGSTYEKGRLNLENAYLVEKGIRLLNAADWEVNDEISVAFDPATYEPFILDLSIAGEASTHFPADEEWRTLRWFRWLGYGWVADLREAGKRIVPTFLPLLDRLEGKEHWPGKEWVHVYASRLRPMSGSWARIKDAHYVNSDLRGVHTWVVVPKPLTAEVVGSYQLVWAWSPVQEGRYGR